MTAGFAHLHTHSYYSFLDGVPSPADLARAAARLDMPALALTDHHGLTGAVEFYDACRAEGVRPIVGLELHVEPPGGALDRQADSLVLLALDYDGWGSLCRLSTAAMMAANQASAPRVSLDVLGQDCGKLLCLTGAWRGRAARLVRAGQVDTARAYLAQLRDLFDDRLYVELCTAGAPDGNDDAQALNMRLASIAAGLGITAAATNNVHMLTEADAPLQRLLTAMRLLTPIDRLDAELTAPARATFVDSDEVRLRLPGMEHALAGAAEAAERCQLALPLGEAHYPGVNLPDNLPAGEALRQRAEAGALRLYGRISPELSARLESELSVIAGKGYAPLFLIMEEIMDYARQNGVPTSSRGSAASSLVAHCLSITAPDPMRLNLYFERFLNPARSSAPDIDTDLCSRRREGVIRHVFDRYGVDRVAMVSTINRFRDRSALREAAKAHGWPPADVTAMVDALPYRGWGPPGAAEDDEDAPAEGQEAGTGLPAAYAALARQRPAARDQQLLLMAARLRGMPRHLSLHPGGVVIAPGAITNLAPRQPSHGGLPMTQFDMASVARLGLTKIDLLGIRGLTVLGDVAQAIVEASPARAEGPGAALGVLDRITEDDADVKAMLRGGRTIGCFQIESPGMRATLKEISAQSVDDLMAALALYRPGPLTGGLKDAFVRRHLGREPAQHLHPALAPLLGETYGVVLYQEQVLRIAHELAGLSLADADLLRRAMSHFDPGQQMQTLKQRFVAGAGERSRVPPDTAERIWELMAAFAGYGFPKAHAASYALVAWRAAWCKAHYPAEFMAAVLANWGGYYSQRVYLTEARRLGLRLLPPHVNFAAAEFSVLRGGQDKCLVMGLNQVRDLTRRTQMRIISHRPFDTLQDFLSRADPRPLEAENLVRVGALEGLGTIPALLAALKVRPRQPGQLQLFDLAPAPAGADDWSLAERVAAQESLLGAGLDAHPLELASDRIGRAGALTTVAAAGSLGQSVRVAGMRQTWRRSANAQGERVYFMSLEDLDGMLEVVIAADVYWRHRQSLGTAGPYVVEGQVELASGRSEPMLRAHRIWRLD